MSMNWAGYEVFGLVLDEGDIEVFKEKYIENHPENFKDYDCEDDIDDVFYEQVVIEGVFIGCNGKYFYTVDIDCTSINGMCDGAIFYPVFTDDGVSRPVNLCGQRTVVVEAFFQCDPVQIFNGRFYKNLNEVINEMKEKMCDYLPKDFPYAKRIGTVTYAAYA